MKIQRTHFESEDQTELSGEWNFPDSVVFGGRRPLVVFAHNRAGRDRNGNGPAIPHYDGFLTLAQGLTQAGYVVFRYDKRGCGQSQGKFSPEDEKVLAQDYMAAVLHAVAHSEVDDWRVFLLGQSQGSRLVLDKLYDIQMKAVSVQGLILLSNVNEPAVFSNVNVPFLIVCGKEDHAFREVSESRLVHEPVTRGLGQGMDSCLGLILPNLGHLLSEEKHQEPQEDSPLEFFDTKMDPAVVDAILPWMGSRSSVEPDVEEGAVPWWKSHFDEEYMQLHRHWEEPQARLEVDMILRELQLPPGGHIVDLGSGYGRHAIELATRGFAVTVVDLSEPLLAQTIRSASERNISVIGMDYEPKAGQIQIVHGDVRTFKLPSPRAADAVIHYDSVLGYFDEASDDLRILETISRILKRDGRLFVETANRDWLVREMQGRGYTRDYDETPYGKLLKEIRWDWFRGVTIERRKLTRPDQTIRRSELRVRQYTLSQWREMLSQYSLDIIRVLPGIHESEPFSGVQSRRMCLVAKRVM